MSPIFILRFVFFMIIIFFRIEILKPRSLLSIDLCRWTGHKCRLFPIVIKDCFFVIGFERGYTKEISINN